MHMTWIEAIGWLAACLSIAGSAMKTIIPLRIIGIATNLVSLVYASKMGLYPSLVVNMILLPLNGVRTWQMLRLIQKVRIAAKSDLSMEWLKPFMTRRSVNVGDVLFSKGDSADCMFYTLSGRFRLKELGIDIPQGNVVGEMGLLSPDQRRSQTLVCIESGEMLSITYDEVRQLYFQNPEFGFYFLRLTSERLFENMGKLEREIARLRDAAIEPANVERAVST